MLDKGGHKAKQLRDCLFCTSVNYCAFIVYYYLKMAYSGLGMVSNIIFDIFGNFQSSTKCWTLDPLFITERH